MSGGSIDREHLTISLVVISLHQWELDFGVVELLDVRSAGLLRDDFFDFNDLMDKF